MGIARVTGRVSGKGTNVEIWVGLGVRKVWLENLKTWRWVLKKIHGKNNTMNVHFVKVLKIE